MTKRLLLGFSFLLGLTFVNACNSKKETPSTPVVPASHDEVETLRTEIRNLRQQVFQLKGKVSRYESISLDPTEKGYSRINTSSGFFLIAVRDTKPYLDGYRLSLAVGNPSTVRYDGFKLAVSWQAPIPKQKDEESSEQYSKRLDEWSQGGHEKEFTFTETLRPSSWNRISIVISPATAEDLKQLTIDSMETDRVILAEER